MLKRLLKLLSGLTLFWIGRPVTGSRPTASISPFEMASNPRVRVSDIRERRLRRPSVACDTCGAFLIAGDSSRLTCRECAAKRVLRDPRPARVSRIPGGVELSLPMSCPVAPGGQTPRIMVRLRAGQAEALSRALLKPGSANLDTATRCSRLAVTWRLRFAEVIITAWTGDKRDADLPLTAAQAARLGEDVAGCLGIIFTDAPTCDHEFVDARNEHVASGELCVRCGAIRAGNGAGLAPREGM